MTEFEKHYKQLNKAQKEAVDSIEGPVMVVAGPGTGKTKILTLRIANILLKTQAEPENILALTFTEAGAAEMRRRLADMIGAPAYRVSISTFHGFCNDVIKQNPSSFSKIIGSESITEVDQVKIIEQAISELSLHELKPFGDPLYYIRPIMSSINELKREGISPDKFRKIMVAEEQAFANIEDLYHEKGAHKGKMKGDYQKLQKQISKNIELAEVYWYYQKTLAEKKYYDFSDMIMEVVEELSGNGSLLLQLQEQYQYILVDEHQDTNNAQNKLIELLCNFHPDPNLFVVGDEKQAIFRFQGASLENFLHMQKLYHNAKLIVLEDNYRSHQSILDAAHSVLAGPKELKSQNKKTGLDKIRLGAFSKPVEELYFLAHDIQKHIKEGMPAEEIAVLYRENRDAGEIARAFEKIGIPYVIESDQDIMSDSDIRKLLLLFKAAVNFGSVDLLLESLHIDFLGINPLDIYNVIAHANEKRISPYLVVKSVEHLSGLDLEKPHKISEYYENLSKWATIAKNENAEQCFEIIIRESGFLASILNKVDAGEKLDRVNSLFSELQALVMRHKDFSLAGFLEYLDTLRTHNILLKRSSHGAIGKVRLMTAHRSKGQEFDCVYIVNAFDGHWGNKRRPQLISLPDRVFALAGDIPEKGTSEDDERRLFYVSLTRARKEVAITYASENSGGQQQLPTQFIAEIKPELVEAIDTDTIQKELSRQKDFMFTAPIEKEPDIKNKEFIKRIFTTYGLSVTGLNNYLTCPWNYFYTNLLRIPKAKSKHQMYGTAVHGALKDLFDQAKTKLPSSSWFYEKFLEYLAKEPLSDADLAECTEKGKLALGGWYETYKDSWNTNVLTEFNVKGIVLSEDVRITGKLDKIELSDGKSVRVVDYKTSKPKTRGDIEGTTKSSEGNIKRQLVFYKLLLSKFDDGKKFTMESGEIDFIEPDEKGRFKKEAFVITDEEVAQLTEQIMFVADEILGLKFWNTFCDDKKCEYCALRKMMN
ncbi:MAG: ATP-dependent helicase [Candidatus Pacebacteria bacterium]|nr:ATP-dependent helicase [Candidatus Paceibacterota bacterium]